MSIKSWLDTPPSRPASVITAGLLAAVGVSLVTAAVFALRSGMVMLGFLMLHSQFPSIPPIGFGASFVVAVAIWLILPPLSVGKSSS